MEVKVKDRLLYKFEASPRMYDFFVPVSALIIDDYVLKKIIGFSVSLTSEKTFIVYSYKYQHEDGRVSYPLCFIFSSPVGE